jgi:hypothetical protein
MESFCAYFQVRKKVMMSVRKIPLIANTSRPVVLRTRSRNGTEKNPMIFESTSPELIIPNSRFPWLMLNNFDAIPQKQTFFRKRREGTHASCAIDNQAC